MVFNGSGTVTVVTLLQGTNDLSGGTLGLFFILLPAFIIYVGAGAEPTREAVTAATFVALITAILGGYLGIVSGAYLITAIVVFLAALFMLVVRS